jgi:CRP/FNR family cyclic AMP-dependent transcriptional regulator
MDRAKIIEIIESCEFFKGLDFGLFEQIADICEIREYQPEDTIFSQGDFGEHLYIVAEGHLLLERSMDLGPRSGNAVIGVLGKGRVLGCWSTLLDEPHNLMSSAVCRKATTVLRLRGSDLRVMMVENPDLGFCLLERLCFLLRDRIQGAYGAMERL